MKPEETVGAQIITVENVGVKYTHRFSRQRREPTWPLRNISFEVNHGEIIGLIGRNGAGKTTLLRVVAGILEPDEGNVWVDGLPALLSIHAGFLLNLSGRDNIILGGMMYGKSRRHMEAISQEIIDFSELNRAIDMPVSVYSTGMRARLGFSVALFTSTEIVLLDETLSVGDAEFQRKSSDAMEKMMSESRTVIIASHNAEILRRLCARVIWIDQGKLQALGPAEDVVEKYMHAIEKTRPIAWVRNLPDKKVIPSESQDEASNSFFGQEEVSQDERGTESIDDRRDSHSEQHGKSQTGGNLEDNNDRRPSLLDQETQSQYERDIRKTLDKT